MHLKGDVLKHLLQFVTFDALGPVNECLLESARLFGGEFERFSHMVHIQYDWLFLVVLDIDDCLFLMHGFAGHHITSANLRLFRRKI